MSKITFRADDELITQLEEFDASKSEIMRQALREYLENHGDLSPTPSESADPSSETLDDLVTERVDSIISDRLGGTFTPNQPQDVNVNITLEGQMGNPTDTSEAEVDTTSDSSHSPSNDVSHGTGGSKTTQGDDENTGVQQRTSCTQCGENVEPSHVYCPNCGEKTSHRVFCECGDEIRSDWAHCPSCGRRTPAADVLDKA